MSIVHCNIAAICLKMGDNGNREFLNLDLLQTDPSVHWYVIAQRHSSNAFLHLDPDSEIFAQVGVPFIYYIPSYILIKHRVQNPRRVTKPKSIASTHARICPRIIM